MRIDCYAERTIAMRQIRGYTSVSAIEYTMQKNEKRKASFVRYNKKSLPQKGRLLWNQ
jgi:hypothetical protein